MTKKLQKFFSKPRNIATLVLLSLIVVVGVLFLTGIFNKTQDIIAPGQIQIKRGDKVITVNENGLVEYRSEEGVFYETWDSSRTNAFFTVMELKAREYLANPPSEIPVNGYEVTLWIDGQIVTIYVAEEDQDLQGLLEELFDPFDDGGGGSGDLDDYFDDGSGGDAGSGGSNPTPSPVPTTNPSLSPTPTSTSGGSGGGSSAAQSIPDCDLYNSLVTQRTVISNTNCQITAPQ